jgi:hypothetical protein
MPRTWIFIIHLQQPTQCNDILDDFFGGGGGFVARDVGIMKARGAKRFFLDFFLRSVYVQYEWHRPLKRAPANSRAHGSVTNSLNDSNSPNRNFIFAVLRFSHE